MSILLALAVAAWQDGRDVSQLIERSLSSFRSEIEQNYNRIEELYRFHSGLQSFLSELSAASSPESAAEIRNVLESFQATVLLTSAWDTALATGALSEIDYETVFALSFTYSFQDRFQSLYNSTLDEVLNLNTSNDAGRETMSYRAVRYVSEITTSESDLLVVYQQALGLLNSLIGEESAAPDAEPAEELL